MKGDQTPTHTFHVKWFTHGVPGSTRKTVLKRPDTSFDLALAALLPGVQMVEYEPDAQRGTLAFLASSPGVQHGGTIRRAHLKAETAAPAAESTSTNCSRNSAIRDRQVKAQTLTCQNTRQPTRSTP